MTIKNFSQPILCLKPFLQLLIFITMTSPVMADFLATGDQYSCVITSEGSAECWGYGLPLARRYVTTESFSHINSSLSHLCGLRTDNTISCWGDNDAGNTTPPPDEFFDVTAGGYYSCGIRMADSQVVCWGINIDIGGTWTGQAAPPEDEFIQISASRCQHTCGVNREGHVVCWGSNQWANQATPPEDVEFMQVTVGCWHSCGLKMDGTVQCWGDNRYGQASPPIDVNFMQISASQDHVCGVRSDNLKIECWGLNEWGQASPPTEEEFVEVSAGFRHTCAISVEGNVHCWGDNTYYQSSPPAHIKAAARLPFSSPSSQNIGTPKAQFLIYPTSPNRFTSFNNKTPFAIAFIGSHSFDPNGHIVEYQWDYPKTGIEIPKILDVYANMTTPIYTYGNANTTLLFKEPGRYLMTLTVKDNEGNTSSASTMLELEQE